MGGQGLENSENYTVHLEDFNILFYLINISRLFGGALADYAHLTAYEQFTIIFTCSLFLL